MPVFNLYALGTGEAFSPPEGKGAPTKNTITSFAKTTWPLATRAGVIASDNNTGDRTLVLDGPKTIARDLTGKHHIDDNVALVKAAIISWIRNAADNVDLHWNMMGFSRGAITNRECLNALKEAIEAGELGGQEPKLKRLKILLFENDPVAGTSDKANPKKQIIPHIQVDGVDIKIEHIATLQMNEMRRDFKPQDLSRTKVENFNSIFSTFLPFLGNHSDGMKVKHKKMRGVPFIINDLAYQLFKKNGTVFSQDAIPSLYGKTVKENEDILVKPSNIQLLEEFSDAKANRKYYEASGKKFKFALEGIPILAKIQRTFAKEMQSYVRDPEFFMNQYERELFKAQYPMIFNHLFEGGYQSNLGQDRAALHTEFNAMRKANPKLFAQLLNSRKIYKDKQSQIYIPSSSQGDSYVEPLLLLHSLQGQHSPVENRKLSNLEKEVKQVTYLYQRQKSELMAFYERAHFTEAQHVREEMEAILSSADTEVNKYARILSSLKVHYEHLYLAGSKSTLLDDLSALLEVHGFSIKTENAPGIGKSMIEDFGQSIRYLGKIFTNSANVVATIFGIPGSFLEDFGRRINDLVGVNLGLALPGYFIKKCFGIPWALGKIGAAFLQVGDKIRKASNTRSVTITQKDSGMDAAHLFQGLGVDANALHHPPVNQPPPAPEKRHSQQSQPIQPNEEEEQEEGQDNSSQPSPAIPHSL